MYIAWRQPWTPPNYLGASRWVCYSQSPMALPAAGLLARACSRAAVVLYAEVPRSCGMVRKPSSSTHSPQLLPLFALLLTRFAAQASQFMPAPLLLGS